jgi:hypothetical protein
VSAAVQNQAELDAALAAGESLIYIESPNGVWLTLRDSGSSHVVAWGSSHVVAWGSSYVVAWGSSHVVAWGSSHVVARDSSHVVAWDSSHVVAWDSSHVVAGRWTAVHLHSQRVTLSGGVIIDMTAIDRTDPQTWCDLNGVVVADGRAVLYKATDDSLTAGHEYRPVTYTVGAEVACDDWRDDHDCGGGLHLSPSPAAAKDYRWDAKRYLAVEVTVADLRPIPGGTAKCKVPRGRVLHEVDLYGRTVTVEAVPA